jgi:hypothetical protein
VKLEEIYLLQGRKPDTLTLSNTKHTENMDKILHIHTDFQMKNWAYNKINQIPICQKWSGHSAVVRSN